LRFTANIVQPAVFDAFATVPREAFVGPGPWRIMSPMRIGEYWTTPDAKPLHVYHDALIALDETRGINNGQPSLWAKLFGELNLSRGAARHLLWFAVKRWSGWRANSPERSRGTVRRSFFTIMRVQ
jgi:protein-L-isoaspartate O-methyltransferase